MKPDDNLSNRMRDLAARLDRFEQTQVRESVVQLRPEPPAAVIISPLEKAIRRWALIIFLGWGLVIYGLFVVQSWGRMDAWDLIFLLCFTLLSALGSYWFLFFFYVELGKSIWRKIRKTP
ncbi:hypothetical protein [Brevundimonas sp.]|uniref:hypothetical protein n=1 Tax=Brevundimonas sp. TaxID=1871086 RepID=UPI00391B5292